MLKPDSLKALLLQRVPQLAAAPERLSLFVDKGRIAARRGSLSYERRYTLNVVIEDYAGDVDAIFVPLLAWIAEHEPNLLDRGQQEPFTFEADLLDGDLVDLSIDLELTECVRVVRDATGLHVTPLPEPRITDEFAEVQGVSLWAALLDDGAGAVVTVP